MLKLAAHLFAPRQFALTSGMALFCGVIEAVFAGDPLRLLVNAAGWRPVMVASGLVTLAIVLNSWRNCGQCADFSRSLTTHTELNSVRYNQLHTSVVTIIIRIWCGKNSIDSQNHS